LAQAILAQDIRAPSLWRRALLCRLRLLGTMELMAAADPNSGAAVGTESRAQLSWKNGLSLVAYIANFAVTYGSLTGVFGATNTDLSLKYQTLVTPAGWAFSIWGPIFISEGVFAVAQMLPRFRGSLVVAALAPWWWGVCTAQAAWTLAFAQEVIPLSLVFMLVILVCLFGIALSTDGLTMPAAEYWLLRAPFSLHLGWIVAASVVNANVQADYSMASPGELLGLAVLSYALVAAIATVFTVAFRSPDPIACLVVSWAFAGVRAELGDARSLNDPKRFNPHVWDQVTLEGLRFAALYVSLGALGLACGGAVLRFLAARRSASENKRLINVCGRTLGA